MARKFGELLKKMSPQAQKKSRALALKYTEEMPLNESPCTPTDAGADGKSERKKLEE
jgi:hypothetical protein